MRRRSDRWTHRAVLLFSGLSLATGVLAAVVGYKALTAIDNFNEFIKIARFGCERSKSRTLEDF